MSFKCLTLRQTEADGLRSVLLDLLVLAALIFFALMNPAQAQQKRVLTSAALGDLTQSVNLAPHTLMLKDPLNKVTPSSIRASGGTILTGSMVDDNIIHLGFDGTPVWLTIKLTGNATSDDWVLDLGRRTEGRVGYLNSLRVYEAFVDQSGINLREIPDPSGDGAFDIKMAKGQEKLVLLNIAPATGRPSTLPLKIYSKDAFLEHVQSRSALNTFLCVSFAGLALFFLSYALTRRNNSYLLYCAHFALITAAWVLYNTVVASAGSDLFGILIPVCLFSFLIISTQITRVYLRIDQSHYTERYILHGLVWLNVSVFILGFILPISNAVTYAFLYYGAPLITLLVILLMAMAQSGLDRTAIRTISCRGYRPLQD